MVGFVVAVVAIGIRVRLGCDGGWWWLVVAWVWVVSWVEKDGETVGESDSGRVRNNNKKMNKNIKERMFK